MHLIVTLLFYTDWERVYNTDDVNISYSNVCDIFKHVCDKHVPSIEKKCPSGRSPKIKPWMTKAILKSIRRKHKLYTKVLSSFHKETDVKTKIYRYVYLQQF